MRFLSINHGEMTLRLSLEPPRLPPSAPADLDLDVDYAPGKVPQLWDVEDNGDLIFKT